MSNKRQTNVLVNLLALACLFLAKNPIAAQAIGGNAVFNWHYSNKIHFGLP